MNNTNVSHLLCGCGAPANFSLLSQVGGPPTGYCEEHRPPGFTTDLGATISELRSQAAAEKARADRAEALLNADTRGKCSCLGAGICNWCKYEGEKEAREKAEAAAAAYRAELDKEHHDECPKWDDGPCDCPFADLLASSEAGRGWVSPEEAATLRADARRWEDTADKLARGSIERVRSLEEFARSEDGLLQRWAIIRGGGAVHEETGEFEKPYSRCRCCGKIWSDEPKHTKACEVGAALARAKSLGVGNG